MAQVPQRPVVAVFDWNVVSTSPAGSLVRQQLEGLKDEFDFIVFAGRFDNPDPTRISFVHVALPPGPSFVKDTLFPYAAAIAFRAWKQRNATPNVIQATQGQVLAPDVVYAHSCHRIYLDRHWNESRLPSSRRATSRFVHEHNAVREKRAFSRARVIAVPSLGLRRDIAQAYPGVIDKIVVIPSPVNVRSFQRPQGFDASAMRRDLGFDANDTVFILVALGNFAHKGLDLVLAALARIEEPRAKVLVVGGSKGEVAVFRRLAASLEITSQVSFVGLVSDVRPYLWSSDAFVLPSVYEGFPLVALQAAAAGLPLIATLVNGLEEILDEGATGWFVSRTTESVADALQRAVDQPLHALETIGAAAMRAVEPFDAQSFLTNWRACYRTLIRTDGTVGRPHV